MSAPIIEFNDVGVRRGQNQILTGVNWRVEPGQRWVLLGPNGAGKTTLLQMAAAREFPSTGTVSVLGERLGAADLFALRTRIGLSSSALADQIDRAEKVRDVVLTAARAMLGHWHERYSDDEIARAHYLLDVFGVDHLAERTFGTLSEGERKRVQCARSLMTDPELLLLDEPGAGLDLGGREALLSALSELAASRSIPAIVLVTHQVETIPQRFTHALLLSPHEPARNVARTRGDPEKTRAGHVLAAGPIAEVLTSDHLSETFALPLNAWEVDGRWVARAAPQEQHGRRARHG